MTDATTAPAEEVTIVDSPMRVRKRNGDLPPDVLPYPPAAIAALTRRSTADVIYIERGTPLSQSDTVAVRQEL